MYYFEKERIHLKTNYIDKMSLQKRLECLRKACCQANTVACLMLSPTTVYPASRDDPLRNSKLDFGGNITAIIS